MTGRKAPGWGARFDHVSGSHERGHLLKLGALRNPAGESEPGYCGRVPLDLRWLIEPWGHDSVVPGSRPGTPSPCTAGLRCHRSREAELVFYRATRRQPCRSCAKRPQPSSLVRTLLVHEVLGEDTGLNRVQVSGGMSFVAPAGVRLPRSASAWSAGWGQGGWCCHTRESPRNP